MSRIAVVDDEKSIREVIHIALGKEYHQVDEYSDGLAQALITLLGLAIAGAIAKGYGGNCSLEDRSSPTGTGVTGCRFALVLPVAPEAKKSNRNRT
jgi:CheY-like chemotaxis protein